MFFSLLPLVFQINELKWIIEHDLGGANCKFAWDLWSKSIARIINKLEKTVENSICSFPRNYSIRTQWQSESCILQVLNKLFWIEIKK
jgi:hypothetical protein